jgi:division/cell wall cluster transcriptional repressor MraZ
MPFFIGSDIYKVDVKGRVNIPSRYTSQLLENPGDKPEGLNFYVTTWSGGRHTCLILLLPEIFKDMAAKMKEECGPILRPNKNIAKYTKIMASAKACRCDSQGRIIISRRLLKEAQIKDRVLILGLDDIIQIWDPSMYEAFISDEDSLES